MASLMQVAGAAQRRRPSGVQAAGRSQQASVATSAQRRLRRACSVHRRRPAVAPLPLGSLHSSNGHGASAEPRGGHGNGRHPTRLGGSTSRVARSAAQTAAVHIDQDHQDHRQDHRRLVIEHSGWIARAHVWYSRGMCVARGGRIGSRTYGTWGGRQCRPAARGASSMFLSDMSPWLDCCCYKITKKEIGFALHPRLPGGGTFRIRVPNMIPLTNSKHPRQGRFYRVQGNAREISTT